MMTTVKIILIVLAALLAVLGGAAIYACNYAINRPKKKGEESKADFPRVTVFGKQAENCEKFLNKGSKLAIEGRLQSGSYEKNGSKVYTMDVVAIRIEFLDSKTETTKKEVDRVPDDFAAIEDDIPF